MSSLIASVNMGTPTSPFHPAHRASRLVSLACLAAGLALTSSHHVPVQVAGLCLAGALLVPWVALPGWQWLAWPVVLAWGAAGAGLYTLAMTEIGHLHAGAGQGPALVQATSVLVLAYTLGGLASPVLVGQALEWGPRFGLAALLATVACAGFWRPASRGSV